MAGIENNILFSGGLKLQPSSATDISNMQASATDISFVNRTGTPEGVVAANPGSICLDPVNGILYLKTTTTGNTGWSAVSAVSYPLSLALGGTNANLTASNGGIFYSTATAGAILAGTATAGQILRSGSNSAPSWSTATYPATTTANRILFSSGTNVVGEISTANNSLLGTSAAGVPSMLTTLLGDFTFTSTTAGQQRTLTVSNSDNTNASSSCRLLLSVGGTSAGDPYICYNIGSARSFAAGVDTSDSQAWKINTNSAANTGVSTGTNLVRLDTSGNFAKPLNGCVTADLNTGLTNATGNATFINPIIFDTDTGSFFDQNGNYDTTTGIFTAAATGKFLVTARVTYNNLDSAHTSGILRINLNGSAYAINQFNPFACANASGEFTAQISCIVPVAATGTIAILGQVSGGTQTVGVKGNTSGSFTSVSIVLIS